MIKTYISNSEILNDKDIFDFFFEQVSEDRREKINRLKFQKDKNLSLTAGVLLKTALVNEGLDYDNLSISLQSNGKPFISGSDTYYNLSHSGQYAICSVSDTKIGCDIEKTEANKSYMKICRRFFSEREILLIDESRNEKDRTDLFYRIWTMRESFMKITGYGLSLPSDRFSANLETDPVTIDQNLDNDIYYIHEIDSLKEYKISVCSNQRRSSQIHMIDLFSIKA